MAGFKYEAVDAQGRTRRGIMEFDTARQVRSQLREQGLIPLEVDALASELGKPRASFGRFGNRLSNSELNLITRQLSTLFEAGLTVDQAFSALIEQADTLKQQQILAAVRGERPVPFQIGPTGGVGAKP